MSIENFTVGLTRTLHQTSIVQSDIQRELHSSGMFPVDIERDLYYDGIESVNVDLMKVVRFKPTFVNLNNLGESFTYPDGSSLSGIKMTFTLCDSSMHKVESIDIGTGDIIVGTTTAWTDEFGEFSVNLWPNARNEVETFYLFHIDYIGMDDALIYIPYTTRPLKFNTAWFNKWNTYDLDTYVSLPFSAVVNVPPIQYSSNPMEDGNYVDE